MHQDHSARLGSRVGLLLAAASVAQCVSQDPAHPSLEPRLFALEQAAASPPDVDGQLRPFRARRVLRPEADAAGPAFAARPLVLGLDVPANATTQQLVGLLAVAAEVGVTSAVLCLRADTAGASNLPFPLDLRDAEGAPVEWPLTFAIPADGSAPPADLDATALTLTERSWFVPRAVPVDLAISAKGCVPVRLPQPAADLQIRLQRGTLRRVMPAAGDGVRTVVRIATDAVRDPWLRARDAVVERAGVAGAPQRVTLGTAGPVEVTAR